MRTLRKFYSENIIVARDAFLTLLEIFSCYRKVLGATGSNMGGQNLLQEMLEHFG